MRDMKDGLVSVITPCYNVSSYITATYNSLVAQKDVSWEWIVIDDFSTDTTIDIINNFNDQRIKLIKSEKNTGNLSILRNKGAQLAQGSLLAFLDGDDICEADRFSHQVELFESHPEAGWCHTNVTILADETGKISPRQNPPPEKNVFTAEEAFLLLARKNYVYISSVMIRKEVFLAAGSFDEDFNRCEDIELWLRLCAKGFSMGYISKPLLQYRVRKSGLFSSKTIEYLNKNFEVYKKIERIAPALFSMNESVINDYLSDNHQKIAIQLLLQKKNGFRDHFKNSSRLNPSIKKTVWTLLATVSPGSLRKYLAKRF